MSRIGYALLLENKRIGVTLRLPDGIFPHEKSYLRRARRTGVRDGFACLPRAVWRTRAEQDAYEEGLRLGALALASVGMWAGCIYYRMIYGAVTDDDPVNSAMAEVIDRSSVVIHMRDATELLQLAGIEFDAGSLPDMVGELFEQAGDDRVEGAWGNS